MSWSMSTASATKCTPRSPSSPSCPSIGEEVKLLVSTIVKEDSITLYGFADESQQSMFELLLTVSGVGPKVALAHSCPRCRSRRSSTRYPVKASSNSIACPASAQRRLSGSYWSLREKITTLVWAQAARKTMAPEQQVLDDAIEGLVALGYNRNDARSAAEKALKSVKDKRDTAAIITGALKCLAKDPAI